jgi:hypothetical protein
LNNPTLSEAPGQITASVLGLPYFLSRTRTRHRDSASRSAEASVPVARGRGSRNSDSDRHRHRDRHFASVKINLHHDGGLYTEVPGLGTQARPGRRRCSGWWPGLRLGIGLRRRVARRSRRSPGLSQALAQAQAPSRRPRLRRPPGRADPAGPGLYWASSDPVCRGRTDSRILLA